jgi:hypothetical protein
MAKIIESLNIKGSNNNYFIPLVNFNGESGICSIEGESYLENAFEFYDKLSGWVDAFFENGGKKLEVGFKMTYFNTSSSRAILDFLKTIKKHQDQGHSVIVNWYYPDPDHDEMQMEGEDFIDESDLQMNLVPYKAG